MVTNSIMVVENEPILRREINSALAEAFFVVADAANYLEALWKLDEFKPDLVVLDEDLPLVDGWEACYQLHRAFGIPVILVGDDSSGEAWIKALEAGADFYLRIPFSYPELINRIRSILWRYKKEEVTNES